VTLHADELSIDIGLVRRLIARTAPQLADLPVRPLPATGSSNALFRLGDELLVRLPRQPGGSATIRKEVRWLSVVAPYLDVDVPETVAVGEPGFGYPEHWAVTRWLPGSVPEVRWDGPAAGPSTLLAAGLADFVRQLRALPPPEVTDGDLHWYRGGTLADLDADFRDALAAGRQLPGLALDLDRALRVWSQALAAEQRAEAQVGWYHGDLLAENLLVDEQGRLSAVLDFGGLGFGRTAVDQIVAWEVLDEPGRRAFRHGLAAADDDDTWAVGAGWALLIALITFPYYWDTMPQRCAARRAMAHAVLTDLGGAPVVG
jgi:aminoglycoside phosphotransferase (APT) family kinase protein